MSAHLSVAADQLSEETRVGDWLNIQLEGDQIIEASIDKDSTIQTKQRIADKLDSLRRRGRRPK